MGDGPGYDHLAQQLDEAQARRIKLRQKRIEMLRNMNATIGFGENDRDMHFLEKEAAINIRRAYGLLEMLQAAQRKDT